MTNKSKGAVFSVLMVLVIAFFVFDLGQYLNLDYLKSQKQALENYYQSNPVSTTVIFFIVYVLVAALSLPGAAIMTLAAGAIFGLIVGTLLVSFASSVGATLAFLISRTLLHEFVQKRFGDSLKPIYEGVKKDGGYYLFTLRLVPAFPFFIVNLVMGLTPIKTTTFYWVSQIGMLAGTLVYVNAGTQLARIESLSDIVSPALIGSFVLLGVFPLLAKKGLELIRSKGVA